MPKKIIVMALVVAGALAGPAAGIASATKHPCEELAEAYHYHSHRNPEYAQTLIGWYDAQNCDYQDW